ncbi:MAG TPA: hypothetical protein VH089_29895 [Streptosporangiaceae bacterium]|nr:hypothetical protein [Streptosporangiaceae bacterium]
MALRSRACGAKPAHRVTGASTADGEDARLRPGASPPLPAPYP